MDKIYLIHFNDGMMSTASDVEPGVFQAANDGELDIIDITDPTIPTLYFNGVWREIELVRESKMKYSIQSQLKN